MTATWYVVGIILVAACSGLFASAASSPIPPLPELASECECTECASELEVLSVELTDCKEQLPEMSVRKVKVLTRTVEVPGSPKKCAAALPKTKPVKSTTCQSGYLCLDDENQANLLHNELVYRSWIAEVQECESR
jgi:hypothetical protein